MDTIRRLIEGTATVLNLLLGTTLLWPPRPNGYRARTRRIVLKIRQNPDLLIDAVYSLRYPLALVTTAVSGAIAVIGLIRLNDEPGVLAMKLAGAAFVFGVGVLTVGAGRTTARYAKARHLARKGSTHEANEVVDQDVSRLTLLRKLARSVYILHLYLLIGAAGLVVLAVFGIGYNIISGLIPTGQENLVVGLSLLLALQGTLTLIPVIRRLRR